MHFFKLKLMQLSIKIFKIQGNIPWTVEHTTFFALNAMQLEYIYKQPQITSVFTTVFSSLAVALVEGEKKSSSKSSDPDLKLSRNRTPHRF